MNELNRVVLSLDKYNETITIIERNRVYSSMKNEEIQDLKRIIIDLGIEGITRYFELRSETVVGFYPKDYDVKDLDTYDKQSLFNFVNGYPAFAHEDMYGVLNFLVKEHEEKHGLIHYF